MKILAILLLAGGLIGLLHRLGVPRSRRLDVDRVRRSGLIVVAALALNGCMETGPMERVEIVAVQCEERGGSADCVTVIQFPDSTRWARRDRWGEVGDVFKAAKQTNVLGDEINWTSAP